MAPKKYSWDDFIIFENKSNVYKENNEFIQTDKEYILIS